MKTLSFKNTWMSFSLIALILLLCAPLMYLLMRKYYEEDLDELIIFRCDEFVSERLPEFDLNSIRFWNEYNDDLKILPFDASYQLDIPFQWSFINKAEGHEIDYRIVCRKIEVEEQPFILVSRIPMIEPHDLRHILISQYGVIFAILLISLTLIQTIVSKQLWKPFYDTLNKINKFDLEKGQIPDFVQTTTGEFNRLNMILTELISNDINAFNQQKRFIENASHELQTPLAVFRSHLDNLLQLPELSEQQVDTIQSLYSVATRMTRLNKNLLLLAKIDNLQFKDIKDIDFTELLQKQLNYLKNLTENNGLKVLIEIDNKLTVKANLFLLETLINNLIINAIAHNIDGGFFEIAVKDNTFIIQNTGIRNPLNTEIIFNRFNRISEEKKGTGLGLSIVSQICKLHDWKLNYHYYNDKHRFVIVFN